MPRMKNVNVYVDVDLTLVDHVGTLLPGAVDGVRKLYAAGCNLYLWSTAGAEYCKAVAGRAGIEHLFDAFLPKPDIFIDDMPSTIFNGLLFNVNEDGPWAELAAVICREHVHPDERRQIS